MADINSKDFLQLSGQIRELTIAEAFAFLVRQYPGKVCFSSSFSLEDQVVTHLIVTAGLPISIFTLDTGRLFAETYAVWSQTIEQYGADIRAYYPDRAPLEEFIHQNGPNAFYASVENRMACCHIRKVEPLKRALAGQSVWITGIRAEHSVSRQSMDLLEWDAANQIIKYNPLLHWSTEEVRSFVSRNNVPYNILQDRGFLSIGCAPCTRAVQPGEDLRAGRWWWEETAKKECGLHVAASGSILPMPNTKS
jgi:phosphoadenosine phosphosulfate reductase